MTDIIGVDKAAELCRRGDEYCDLELYDDAFDLFLQAATIGYAEAQFKLGSCYYEGLGAERDSVEAFLWFKKAAEQGHAAAQRNVAMSYFKGEGVQQDKGEAVNWLIKAAENGHAKAQSNLGFCYAQGDGVAQNGEEAFKWFKKSTDQGDADGMCGLGMCYILGTGTDVDENEGLRLLNKAAEMGSELAREQLAKINDANDRAKGKSGAGYIILRVLTFPFWLAWQFIKAIMSLFKTAFGDSAFVRGFKSGYNGDSDGFKEYTFTNDMGCEQTVYSKNGREFYDANGGYVGRSDDGGKTIHG